MTDTLPIPLTSPLSRAQKASLVNLVRRAAKAEIMPRFRNMRPGDINTKSGPYDLVTEADQGAEAMLARGLQQMFPHALVVGEEAASADVDLRAKIADAELAFILDPVDGTWNFAHGLAVFGVIVAVTRFGKPVYGLLYDPVMDDFIWSEEDGPTRLTTAKGFSQALSVSSGKDVKDLSGFIHFYLLPEDKQAEMAEKLPGFGRTHALRCSCHEYRTLAQGGADFLISGTLNPWDHAAGVLICQRAGGVVKMLDGRDYNAGIETGYLLAAPDVASWDKLADVFAFLGKDAKG
ncbi:MAG: inositol monophosphatase [Pseudomonadota bacterium]